MDILILMSSCTVILTITTKVGFIIQRTYFDIRGIALSSFLATVTLFVTLGMPIIGLLAAYMIFLYLLCKIGKINIMPDAVLATIIGCGIEFMIMIDYIKDVSFIWFT